MIIILGCDSSHFKINVCRWSRELCSRSTCLPLLRVKEAGENSSATDISASQTSESLVPTNTAFEGLNSNCLPNQTWAQAERPVCQMLQMVLVLFYASRPKQFCTIAVVLLTIVINQILTQEAGPFQCWVKWPLLISFPVMLQNVVVSLGLRSIRYIQAIISSLPFFSHHSQFFYRFPHFDICPSHFWAAVFSAASSLDYPCLLPFRMG